MFPLHIFKLDDNPLPLIESTQFLRLQVVKLAAPFFSSLFFVNKEVSGPSFTHKAALLAT